MSADERPVNAARSPPPARVGDPVAAIDTPALVVDVDAMERNLARMAAYARDHRVALRPHAKLHKSVAIAALQVRAGAVGVCVQKLAEAEVLAAGGVADIFITNEIVDPSKLARFAALAGRCTLAIAVDSVLGIERLASALRAAGTDASVFVEVDVGQGRCGAAPEAAAVLAQQVLASGLRFAGLQAYHGGAQHLRLPAQREAAIGAAVARVRIATAALAQAGIACPLVTGAGTGSFVTEAASGVYGELQVGSFMFMDADYAQNTPAPGAPRFEHALFVKSQVMSRCATHAVVDAGHKSHAIDSGMPLVWGQPGLTVRNGGDEHGVLVPAPGAALAALPELGETVWLVPGHCDPTVNLHDHYVVVRGGLQGGVVEAVWGVDARGCSS